jgi:hypothetical protein
LIITIIWKASIILNIEKPISRTLRKIAIRMLLYKALKKIKTTFLRFRKIYKFKVKMFKMNLIIKKSC